MKIEQEKDEHAITMFVLRYEAKISAEAKANYLKRFKRIMHEEGANIPLVAQSEVERLQELVNQSLAQTDKCLAIMNQSLAFSEAEAERIMPTK